MTKSTTPRTDAQLSGIDSFGNIPTPEDRFQRMCRHARILETELAAAAEREQAAGAAAFAECIAIGKRELLSSAGYDLSEQYYDRATRNYMEAIERAAPLPPAKG